MMSKPRTDTRSSGSVLSDMYGALTRVFGGLWSRYGGWGWSRIRLFLPSARFDWEREAADTWMNSAAALAIKWLGDRFPRPKIQVLRIEPDGSETVVGRHAMLDLWGKPNPYYSRRTLEKAVGLSIVCDGNAYIYKVRSARGDVVQLWWVPHFRILPTWPSDGSAYIDGYRVWLDTAVYHLPPQDIIHIRDGIDPRNERLGLSAMRAALREVVTDNLAAGYTAALLKNCGVPGLVVMPDGDSPGAARPDGTAARRIEERIQEQFSGEGAGGTIVLNSSYRLEAVGFSPDQMKLDVLPQNAVARITAAIGVAAMSCGLPDPQRTYSNLEEANRSSWGAVTSIQELIGEALRWQLLPEPIVTNAAASPGADPYATTIAYDYADVQELRESLDAVHARAREDYQGGGITRNEYRQAIDMAPVEGGDAFAEQVASAAAAQAAPAGEPERPETAREAPGEEDVGDDAGAIKFLDRFSLNGHAR